MCLFVQKMGFYFMDFITLYVNSLQIPQKTGYSFARHQMVIKVYQVHQIEILVFQNVN